jgi:hypothetical protein
MKARRLSLLSAGGVLFAAACIGNVSDPERRDPNGVGRAADPTNLPPSAANPGAANAPGTACAAAAPDASEAPLRRLSVLEYQLTLQDLFQLPSPPSVEGIPPDTDKDGFKTYTAIQTVSAQHLRAYTEMASQLTDDLLADAARRTAVIGCRLDAADCVASFVARFGRLAFRRALDPAEANAIVSAANTNALDVNDRYRFAIETLLSSPSFLYRVELGDKPSGVSKLTGQELASRLSFALWGRAPSAQLLDQASTGALDTPQGFDQIARQLAADARTQLFFESFFRQWLGFEQLRAPKTLPAGWNDALLGDMQRETSLVLADYAWSARDFLDVLTTNMTRVTPALATFYGLPAPGSDGTLTFRADHPRANTGLLTHASLLGAKSDGDRIAIRGNWLRRTFLCKSLQVPPEVAEQFGELLVGLTRVEIVKKRNSEAACKGCHASIDPIGIGFEQFDESGRFDASVDVAKYGLSAALPDAADPAFDSVAKLASMLRELPEVSSCLTSRLFLYTNGREPQGEDACTVASAASSFGTQHDFRALVSGLVEAPAFRLRRAASATP